MKIIAVRSEIEENMQMQSVEKNLEFVNVKPGAA
jgi:hypothetical protein